MQPFHHWRAQPRPPQWDAIFGGAGPLEIEIGFGNGDYLVRNALDHPERRFIGFEPEWIPVQRSLRKIAAAGVRNVRVLQIDARVGLERLFAPRSVDAMLCLFPCPWPKKKHIKFRLFSTRFLEVANSRLVDDHALTIVTDDADYRDWILEEVPRELFEVDTQTVGAGFETKYERRWRSEGQETFFQITLTKTAHHALPLVEDKPLETPLVPEFEPKGFDPQGSKDPFNIEFKDQIYDPDQKRMVVRTIAGEEGLLQDFWVEIIRQENGWRVRPLRACGTVPTLSVQRALDRLAEQMH